MENLEYYKEEYRKAKTEKEKQTSYSLAILKLNELDRGSFITWINDETYKTIKKNKVIAEFMGGKYTFHEPWCTYPTETWRNIKYHPDTRSHWDIKYHSSLDWLIPVYYELKKEIVKHDCDIDFCSKFMINIENGNILESWNILVDAINWLNNK